MPTEGREEHLVNLIIHSLVHLFVSSRHEQNTFCMLAVTQTDQIPCLGICGVSLL